MNIWEKLARCDSPGEIQRVMEGTGWALVESTEIKRLWAGLAAAVGFFEEATASELTRPFEYKRPRQARAALNSRSAPMPEAPENG